MASKAETAATYGMSMGATLAMILSYSVNHSSLWAILHGVCSWIYCVYFWVAK